MLIATGIMLGFVLVVMVGESAQELQQAGWLMVTPIHIAIPDWMGLWFALFPNVQGIVAQVLAGAFVVGSYVIARDMRAKRPFRHVEPTSTGTIGQRQAV